MRGKYEMEVDKLIDALEVAVRQQEKLPGFYKLVTDNTDIKSAEVLRTIQICENDSFTIGDLLHWLKYTKKPRHEHYLTLNDNGRYVAGDTELTSGSSIEFFVEDSEHDDCGWNFGSVEHSDKYGGYYFCNGTGWEHHRLAEGSRVAIRW